MYRPCHDQVLSPMTLSHTHSRPQIITLCLFLLYSCRRRCAHLQHLVHSSPVQNVADWPYTIALSILLSSGKYCQIQDDFRGIARPRRNMTPTTSVRGTLKSCSRLR